MESRVRSRIPVGEREREREREERIEGRREGGRDREVENMWQFSEMFVYFHRTKKTRAEVACHASQLSFFFSFFFPK
jgi:hypothetical protein